MTINQQRERQRRAVAGKKASTRRPHDHDGGRRHTTRAWADGDGSVKEGEDGKGDGDGNEGAG
jgi:hypothetical protein